MPAQHLGRADEAIIIGDENGFELHIETAEGSYVVNIHGCAEELLVSAYAQIGQWLAERDAARASRPLRDDPDAYAADDPKHPDWHSVHADLYPREAS